MSVDEEHVAELMKMLEITEKRDALLGNKVLALLVNGIRRYHRTMMMITHDMDIAKQADVTVRMDELK